MSDFFTRLAGRTLGMVPVVQPIIAPVFAPNTLNDNPEGLVQDKWVQGALDKTQKLSPLETQPAFSRSDLTVEAKLSEIITDNNFPEMKTEHNNILKTVSKSVSSRDLLENKYSNANIPDRSVPNELSTDAAISKRNRGNSPEDSLIVQKDASGGHRIILNELKTPRQTIPVSPETQHSETSTSMNCAQRGFHSQTAATPVSSLPAPTIQVTIGRIEVRAISPPVTVTQAQRARTPGPALSLEDYLKQRNGGQR